MEVNTATKAAVNFARNLGDEPCTLAIVLIGARDSAPIDE
jgi:hypothetical protein